ncbi:MAG TPA: helix-turn-helix domain-containing protein [Solirubrobacteraceae bacterium]|nr:helix-turn-helix domain-containing protein [Solirubrobacteraceae bacterium]
MDENSLKVLLARGLSVEQIGRRFQRDPSTVAYWMRKYGLVARNREKYAPKGGIDRGVLEGLVDEGKFHHLDPSEKRLEDNCAGATISLAALRLEAAKCVVLCSNCHAQVEGGIASLPIEWEEPTHPARVPG